MGCGWLGLPLASFLVKKGYTVRGTTTSETKIPFLEENGIKAYLISLGEAAVEGDIGSFLNGLDTLVINIPPSLRKGNTSNYVLKLKGLLKYIRSAGIPKVIFVSSTSVYGVERGKVSEETLPNPDSESGKQLLEVENLFMGDQNLKITIIRFGGLIGPGRHPVNFLSGRKDLKNGHHPVNLIHLEDCIRMIVAILENGWWNVLFNGVYPEHPSKKNYYSLVAEKKGLPALHYKEESDALEGKIVESPSLEERGFTFSKGIWDS